MLYVDTVMHTQPSLAACAFDCGGLVIDRDSGDVGPADQFLKDPLHIDQFDMFDDHLGSMKLGLIDGQDFDAASEENDDEEEYDDEDSEDGSTISYEDFDDELARLIAEQKADMTDFAAPCTTSAKRRFAEFGNDKTDSGRLYRRDSHGHRGRKPRLPSKIRP